MRRNEKGQGLVEYALILVLVAVVMIAMLTLLGNEISEVFDRIVAGLSMQGGNGNDLAMTVRQGEQLKRGRYWTEGPGSVEYTLEKVEVLEEGAVEEEEALRELALLMEETMLETLEVPIEFAQYADDTTLFEYLSSIRDAALAGEYEAVLALLAETGGQSGSLPAGVQLEVAAKYTPRAVRACQIIDGKQVPYQDYVEAREAMVLLGELDRALLIDEAWDDIIEPRNAFIAEIQPALIQSAEAGIAFLLDSGTPKYVTLAEEMQDELATCGGG